MEVRPGEKLLQRRKLYILVIVSVTIVFLLIFNLGNWLFLNQMEQHLDEELGKRLQGIAQLTAKLLEELRDPIERPALTARFLEEIRKDHELQGAFIVDFNYQELVGDIRVPGPVRNRSYLAEDSAYIVRAWQERLTVTSPLHLFVGNRFKSAYAPVYDGVGRVAGILVLEANADFFDILSRFQQSLVIGSLASLAFLIILGLFFFWAIRLFLNTEKSLRRSERLAVLGQMAAAVAHEIRNPLGIIKGTADLLQEKYDRKDQPDELFQFIPEEIRRLNRLVNDFLTFAREPRLEKKVGALETILQDSVNALQSEMTAAGVDCQLETTCQVPPFAFDPDAIHQVLLNLLINATQAMASTGGTITVRCFNKLVKGKKMAGVEVRDTGPGFDEKPQNIFEPFYTTRNKGSGLGLAICKQLIEAHGGWMEALSIKGQGSTFRFFIPIQPG